MELIKFMDAINGQPHHWVNSGVNKELLWVK